MNNSQLQVDRSVLSGRKAVRFPLATVRSGMTLIELLVVIIILVTLVAGVLPLLSPNNDANKIQSATRSLQSYLQKAQTKAMRTGRPVGVMFRESQFGSGVALEAYQVEVPPDFTGFSSASTAVFEAQMKDSGTKFKGYYEIRFGEGFGSNFVPGGNPPAIPPRMVRVGDRIEVGNSVFRLQRGLNSEIDLQLANETGEMFFQPTNSFGKAELVSGPSPPTAPIASGFTTFPDSFAIARQPVVNSEPPLTLPKGVGVDMTASGFDGSSATLFAGTTVVNPTSEVLKQISLMFSPTGGIQYLQYNGENVAAVNGSLLEVGSDFAPRTNVNQVTLLLATIEKSGIELFRKDGQEGDAEKPWVMSNSASDDQLDQAREKVSWLNPDSRWVAIKGRSGLIQVADNSLIDPRGSTQDDWKYAAWRQIRDSRGEFSLSNRVDDAQLSQ